jgi:phage shock protein A
MVVAMARFCVYQGSMTEQQILARILELEQQLLAANETVAKLILSTTELTRKLSEADTRNKKLKRSSRRDESSFREQLSIAQSRRF